MEKTNAEVLGLVSKEEIRKQFDEMLPWDKKEFIEKLNEDYYNLLDHPAEDDDNDCEYPSVWEFIRDHNSDEILSEMDMWELLAHLRDYYTIKDILEFIMREGKSSYRKAVGYSKEEILKIIEEIEENDNAQ